MTDLVAVLRFLGFGEVRPVESGEWAPVSDLNDPLHGASTDEVHVLVHDRWTPPCRLVDPSTGERVAVARSPESPEP
jgi:hypothetical protein